MPASTQRKIDEHYEAKEPIPADQFIPRFLKRESKEAFKDKGNVGVRGFVCSDYSKVNPYLTLSDITVGPPLMFPDHPHCGHEMMMYVLDGAFTHEDHMGWTETFEQGDVHWMTTGKGIIHAQVPKEDSKPSRHVQFWINLPQNHKYCDPNNQVLRAAKTPVGKCGDAVYRLLTGKFEGKESSLQTKTPILIMDVRLPALGKTQLKIPGSFFVGLYVLEGKGSVPGTINLKKNSIVLSKPDSSSESLLELETKEEGLRLLLFAGEPINEPMEFDGYFVCLSKDDTNKAINDFDKGEGPFVASRAWSSKIANK